MAKLIAVLNVVAWSGFWAFGYLAVTSDPSATGQMMTAVVFAALGGAMGIWAYLWIVRHSEATGYAQPSSSRARHDASDNGGMHV